MKSSYTKNFDSNNSGNHQQKQFNLDRDRRQFKIPYKPPASYVTTNNAALFDTKGTNLIGALTSDGKGYVRRVAPKGETENIVPNAFQNTTANQLNYGIYPKLPAANRRPQKQFAPGYGKLETETAYHRQCSVSPDQKYKKEYK